MAPRSAYWREFYRWAVQEGLAVEIPEYEIIAVLHPISIPVTWMVRGSQKGQLIWRLRNGLAEYRLGQVLHRERREATQWETDEAWPSFTQTQLDDLGVFRGLDGKLSIQIVEKIQDLPAAIRQRGRHIPQRLILTKHGRFEVAGQATLLTGYARRLNDLLEHFLQQSQPDPEQAELDAQELGQLYSELEPRKTDLVVRARHEIDMAQQGQYWRSAAQIGQAMTFVLQARVRQYEIATSSIDLALKWRELMASLQRRFRSAYDSLGRLAEALQGLRLSGQPVGSVSLLRFAQDTTAVWNELQAPVLQFSPYYDRLAHNDCQRLSRVVMHASDGRDGTVFNDIDLAFRKLQAEAIGPRPTRAELITAKRTL